MSADYLSQLLALQPPGAALPREPESVWVRLLAALADGFERVDARSNDLVRESDPRSCIELITDWERVCGLPGECLADDSIASLQGRRAAVVNVLTRGGGQTPAFFKRLRRRAFTVRGTPVRTGRRTVLLDGDGSRSARYVLSVRFFILR